MSDMLIFICLIIYIIVVVTIGIIVYIVLKRKFKDRILIKTQIIGNDSTKSASSSIVRGAIGGALFGNLGMIGGALSGKNNNSTTFLLIYKDGTKKTATVKNDTRIYKTYIQLLEV